MASITFTVAAGGNAGAQYRAIAKAIQEAVAHMPDTNSTGASSVLTITDTVGPLGTVRVTGGPYQYVSGGGVAEDTVASPTVKF